MAVDIANNAQAITAWVDTATTLVDAATIILWMADHNAQ